MLTDFFLKDDNQKTNNNVQFYTTLPAIDTLKTLV